jgi:molybdate transport system substrate-binding protein
VRNWSTFASQPPLRHQARFLSYRQEVGLRFYLLGLADTLCRSRYGVRVIEVRVASMFVRVAVVLLGVAVAAASHASAAEPLQIYAAGSLTAAFTDMVRAFPAPAGTVAPPVFGPSGVLRDRIEHGEPADLLASADMDQPRALAHEKGGRQVVMFTRNRLCALARASVGLTPDNTLEKLLDPNVRLATSTPHADPGGDYTWAVFARAEAVHPGAQAILEAKALQLVGGPNSQPLVAGRGAAQGVFLADRADVMLGYCSGAGPIVREISGLTSVSLPPALTVGPAYGLIVLSDNPLAARFALFVLSEQGQAILLQHGFDPIGLATR